MTKKESGSGGKAGQGDKAGQGGKAGQGAKAGPEGKASFQFNRSSPAKGGASGGGEDGEQ